jgi:hypothetical protein
MSVPSVSPAYQSCEDFAHAFRSLPLRGSLVYHTGLLAKDRYQEPAAPTTQASLIDQIANIAMQLEQEGRAELVQRRISFDKCEYIIQKRRVVDEEAACDWTSFGGRIRQRDRRPLPVRILPLHHYDLRAAFLHRNPQLSAGDIALCGRPPRTAATS